jgi:hypothetical protein
MTSQTSFEALPIYTYVDSEANVCTTGVDDQGKKIPTQ